MPASKDSDLDQKPLSCGLTRRQFIPLLGATAALATGARSVGAAKPSDAQARFVYVGTYTFPGVPPGGTHRIRAMAGWRSSRLFRPRTHRSSRSIRRSGIFIPSTRTLPGT